MASTTSVRSIADPLGVRTVVFVQDAKDRTGQANVTGAASDIYYIEIDNGANAVPSYLKVYDQTGTPTHGTTEPVLVVRAPANGTATLAIPGTFDFGNGLSMLVSTDGGVGTAEADLIELAVTVTLLTT